VTNKEYPILFKKSKKAIQEWLISVFSKEDGTCGIMTTHGQVGGKMQTDILEVKEGKNVGKTNQTSTFDQACSEAQSKWNKQIDKGYTEDASGESDSLAVLPMLAQKFKDKKHMIDYTCAFEQPKLNGVRMISGRTEDDTRFFQSRLGKYWDSITHLTSDLDKLGIPVTDGEVFLPDTYLQDILSLVKKKRTDTDEFGIVTEDLEYWIYDIVDTTKTFKERNFILWDAFYRAGAVQEIITPNVSVFRLGKLVYVQTRVVYNHDEVLQAMNSYITDGFEGAMVRNGKGMYELNTRSNDLQKVKTFIDGEFKIIGGYCVETGRDKGTCVFRCVTDSGVEFDVRPMGTLKQRMWYWDHLSELINKHLTCRFQEWTNLGSPFHARGVAIRDVE